MQISQEEIKIFQNHILSWYAQHQRDLPWRKSRDPYKILVSEIMLQQTQVQRVIPKYKAWLEKFPTVYHLATASTAEVLQYWSGLGYNRRALYLQKCAKEVVEKYQGEFPQDEKELQKLPGIGVYTSRALLCFAFDKQVAVVDTNVKKVILTQMHVHEKDIEQIAQQLLPIGKAYEWNQALMDYSSSVLKNHKIPIPKQSKFKDSDRYYRGAIIRFLLQHRKLTGEEIVSLFQNQKTTISVERLEKILLGLQKDKLIMQHTLQYMLPEAENMSV